MNFLIDFEPSFQTYLTSFTPTTEGQLPITFFDFVRNELRKKQIQIFSNDQNETILARFKGDKPTADLSDSIVLHSRSIIFDQKTHATLMIAPPKSYEYEDFKTRHPTMDGVKIEDFPLGPMINVYYHPSKGWQMATRSYVGANNTFRSDKSFRVFFEEALLKTTGLTFSEFTVGFQQNHTFSFVLMHPDYFDVTHYAEPSLVIVEVRDRAYDHSMVPLEDVEAFTSSAGWKIKYPKHHTFASWEAVDEFIKTQPSQEQGLVFRFGNERSKIQNPEFIRAQKLLGNHTKMIDIFADNLRNQSIHEFLEIFPEKMTEFHHFSEIYRHMINETHSYYIAHHTRPVGQKIVFSEIPRPLQTAVWNIHKQYMESGTSRETRRQVKPIVVENYFKNLTAVELGNVMSYWDTYLKENPIPTIPKIKYSYKPHIVTQSTQ
jgi:hypothetical protein